MKRFCRISYLPPTRRSGNKATSGASRGDVVAGLRDAGRGRGFAHRHGRGELEAVSPSSCCRCGTARSRLISNLERVMWVRLKTRLQECASGRNIKSLVGLAHGDEGCARKCDASERRPGRNIDGVPAEGWPAHGQGRRRERCGAGYVVTCGGRRPRRVVGGRVTIK